MYQLRAVDYKKESDMMQVMNLPYLLQSLVSTKAATCVQPQSKGTVHHYPAHCSGSNNGDYIRMEDRSSTANCAARVNYQCAVAESGTRNGAGVVRVKREVMADQTQPGKTKTKSCFIIIIITSEFLIPQILHNSLLDTSYASRLKIAITWQGEKNEQSYTHC